MKLDRLLLSSVLLVGSLFAGTYKVDKSHTNVGFQVKHMMISNVKGSFDNFDGSFIYDEKTKKLKNLNAIIKVASINTADKERDEHLKEEELFAAKKFPEIKFKLTKVENGKAYGDFTLRGITKNIALDINEISTVKDPWGNERAGFSLEGKINRQDYGIKWNKALEMGGVAVSNNVKFLIDVQGIKEKVN